MPPPAALHLTHNVAGHIAECQVLRLRVPDWAFGENEAGCDLLQGCIASNGIRHAGIKNLDCGHPVALF